MTTSSPSLLEALAAQTQATANLIRVCLALEWTVFSRSMMSVVTIAFFYLVYLIFTLRNVRQPLTVWEKLGKPVIKPFRPWVYSFLLGKSDPYANSIDMRVSTLSRGFCTAIMRDRHRNRNPFKSIHATALATFAETVGGLALMSQFKRRDRAILVSLSVKYLKKARGLLTASSEYTLEKDLTGSHEIQTEVIIKDRMLDTVAKMTLNWKIDVQES
ncbi:Thioesterase/thiol ester dehydrase-isomerase [Hesseltinella vesiculosa]|uniref:Thioesterase/thiol ester dehydrase-isomerase n=1 Tax=Hesseltinella vesiculosa TaxID=101127 RepID=A0A1X2G5V8_9FUNG|nr:Thioesterase/thiol ester dehydrase-isomerase [Hesseltinella vesiculosa]